MSRLTFRLLGPLPRIIGTGGEILVSSKKGLALLAYLAMHCGERIDRSALATLLWSDHTDAQARQNLRQTLHTLRRDLGAEVADVLIANETAVALDVTPDAVDALAFVATAGSGDLTQRQRCLDIAWDTFLHSFSTGADTFDEWAISEQHRIGLIATRAFSELAARFDAEGDGDRAILAVERLVQIDPSDEETHRRLLKLEARHRGAETALARARALADLLKRALDAEPEQATLDLIDTIRLENGTRAAGQPAVAFPTTAATREPAPPTGAARPGTRRLAARPLMLAAAVACVGLGLATYARWPDGSTELSSAPAVEEPSWKSPRGVPQAVADLSAGGVVAIAARPFEAHDESGEANEVAAALSDDLTNNLSRIPTLRVISQSTMNAYRGQPIDAAALGAELGVRYLVEGSISTRDGLLRVNVALVDTRTRLTVWSTRFERPGAKHRAIQDEIVAGLGRTLQIAIARKEGADTSSSPDVHVLAIRGWASVSDVHKSGKPALDRAELLFKQALDRDPDNLRAKMGLAAVHTHLAVQLLVADPQQHLAKAEAILQPLIASYPNNSGLYSVLGLVRVAQHKTKEAVEAYKRAIELNPSHAPAYAQLGHLRTRLGDAAEGLELVEYAKRLSPRDPILPYWHAFSGAAKLQLGQFDDAVADTRLALSLMPWQPRTGLLLVAALAMAGHESEARRELAELQQRQPHLTDAALFKTYSRPSVSKLAMSRGLLRVLQPVQSSQR
jgi:DNA-binding SARP family transcriptional activator/TolB-like protein/cytochrome c-type biogenesis protein CcmH/NrfG